MVDNNLLSNVNLNDCEMATTRANLIFVLLCSVSRYVQLVSLQYRDVYVQLRRTLMSSTEPHLLFPKNMIEEQLDYVGIKYRAIYYLY